MAKPLIETTSMKIPGKVFIDTNVLVYANDYNKPEGKIAYTRISNLINSGNQLYISPQVLSEYANAVMRDALENKRDLSVIIPKIQHNIDLFKKQFAILYENEKIVSIWKNSLSKLKSNKQVYDYYIAATMEFYGIEAIITRNVTDFKMFKNISILPLDETE